MYQLIALKAGKGGKAPLGGDVITDARDDFDKIQGSVVSMTMNAEGAKVWEKLTRDNIGNAIAIVLDNQVYSFPNVNSAISGGSSQITGGFSPEEAKDLANVLKSGKMAAARDYCSRGYYRSFVGTGSYPKRCDFVCRRYHLADDLYDHDVWGYSGSYRQFRCYM